MQCDEIWSFCYAKNKNVKGAKAAPDGAGDLWTWTALDADSKLMISWTVGNRDADSAFELMEDLRDRVKTRMQLTTDGWRSYIDAVGQTFGPYIDYAQLVKIYGPSHGKGDERRYSPAECVGAKKVPMEGAPDLKHVRPLPFSN